MKNKISDQDVLNLLSNLRNAENNYPSEMIKSRRDSYVKQAAVMAALAGTGVSGTATNTGTNQTTVSNATGSGLATGKLLEIAIVLALVVEVGVAAYIYRDQIADFINSTLSPKVETIASPPAGYSPDITASEEASTETPNETETVTATETLVPSVTFPSAPGNNGTGNNDGGNIQVESTPDPNDNPGLHLGQTKQPTLDPNSEKKNTSDQNKNKD